MYTSPPVSLSSTRMSNFNSLQGISGSSPITVKVASNSPSTRNFTRPLAAQTSRNKDRLNTKRLKQSQPQRESHYQTLCLPTVRFANWGGKSVVTRRCRRIWLSWFSVVCFSDLVIGSGGMILSYTNEPRNTMRSISSRLNFFFFLSFSLRLSSNQQYESNNNENLMRN